tara:strand:+ start:1056 stop:1664 length:609 start_codon:yes stop_codon:yes gene_type:complete
MKRVFLTKEQLSRVITNVIAEGKTTLPLTVGSNNQGYEFTTPTGPSTSGAVGEKAPNTGGGEYGPIFTDTTDKSYEEMYDPNLSPKDNKSFKGPNNHTIPGAGDDGANLKMKDDFGISGVDLKTMGDDYDIKIGDRFMKDLKKGKLPKRSKTKHAPLHPNRHINKAKSKNINHADGVTRAGVTFDTKFKPGTGADPFTVKTS